MRDIGINGVRMFLPFYVWFHDGERFLDRLESFLRELDRQGIAMMPVIFNDCVGFGKPRDITPPLAKGWHSYDIGHHGGHKSNPFTGEKNLKGWIYWDESEWRPVMEEYLSALLFKIPQSFEHYRLGFMERTRQQQPSRYEYSLLKAGV